MIGTFMAVLDATIVNVALAKIMTTFGVDIEKVEWVATAYMLAFAVLLPTSSWIADRLGHKRTYVLALLIFTGGSALCGLAWDEDALIVSRVIQAIGAGCIMPVAMTIVAEIFPPQQRGQALGIWGIAGAASATMGPTIGGYLVDYIGWRSVFYVNLPVGIIGTALVLVVLREIPSRRAGRFDLVGFLAMTVGLSGLLLALAQGQSKGWDSGYVRTCEGCAIIGLGVFVWWELRQREPLVDLSLFRSPGFSIINLIALIFGVGMFGSTFLLPIFLQNMLGYPALLAGLTLLPAGLVMGVVTPVAGRLSDRIGAKPLVMLGLAVMAFSMYLNSHINLQTSRETIYSWLVLRGIGMGLMFSPMTSLALGLVPRLRAGQASGLLNVIRQVGGSFGIAIFGTLLARRQLFHAVRYAEAITAQNLSALDLLHQMQGHFVSLGDAGGLASQKALAVLGAVVHREAATTGFSDCFLVAAWICALGVIPALFLPRHLVGQGAENRRDLEKGHVSQTARAS
ncbi:MAG: DHA2 family efflux MFS transporter permease subunit [Firmicutes bacterium]|nr:DHA2 family efflux MFS transporter permease subunit [Bacillota bacterium]